MYPKDLICANHVVTTTITIITTSPKMTYPSPTLQLHVMHDRAILYKMVQVNQCITTITLRVRRIITTITMHLEASHKVQ
jgi:hypothetical protein